MTRATPRLSRHHEPRSLARRVLGWLCIGIGIAMLILPGPGLIVIAVGVILLGRQNPTLRRWAVILRLQLRQLKHAQQPLLRRFGAWLYMYHRRSRHFIHQQHELHARGEPLAPLIQIWIGITILGILISLGLSIFMILP